MLRRPSLCGEHSGRHKKPDFPHPKGEAWQARLWQSYLDYVAPDVVLHNVPNCHDRESWAAFGESLAIAYPDSQTTYKMVVVEGDLAAAWWTYRGTHTQPLGDHPPVFADANLDRRHRNLYRCRYRRATDSSIAPSCCNQASLSIKDQCSTIRPSRTLVNIMVGEALIYDRRNGRQIGEIKCATWSPILKANLALADISYTRGSPPKQLWARIDYQRELKWLSMWAECKVVDKPFYRPEHRTATPPNNN